MRAESKKICENPVSQANRTDVNNRARRAKIKRYLADIGNKLNLSQLSFYK